MSRWLRSMGVGAAGISMGLGAWAQGGATGTPDKSLPTEAHAPAAARAQGEAAGAVKPIDRRSAAAIEAQAKTLLAQAQASESGSASVTLERYPGHVTMLTVRTKSGGAEMHGGWNDMFVVVDGEATEMTGGTIVGAKETTPGETRGSKVEGGTPTLMQKGDVIHISPNTPHQTVLTPGKTFTYYVIKVEAPKS